MAQSNPVKQEVSRTSILALKKYVSILCFKHFKNVFVTSSLGSMSIGDPSKFHEGGSGALDKQVEFIFSTILVIQNCSLKGNPLPPLLYILFS